MMDWKQINEIRTPEVWIEDVLHQTEELEQRQAAETEKIAGRKKKRKGQRWGLGAAAGIACCLIISVSAAAAVSQDFREWVFQQIFHTDDNGKDMENRQVTITKVSLPKGYDMLEDGFLIANYDTEEETDYRAENGELKKCEKKHMESSLEIDGKTYEFSFDYAQDEWRIHGYHYEGAVVAVSGYKNQENKAIVWLWTDHLWESYYLDLDTGDLFPVVDESELSELMASVMAVSEEAVVKYATDVQVSPEGTYLLYKSNRDCLPTDSSHEYDPNANEWFVKNNITGKEVKLEGADGILHTNEIGFLDDTHISAACSVDEKGETGEPGIYDCKTGEWTWLESDPDLGTTFYDSLIYEIPTEEGYAFYDRLNQETYLIPADDDWEAMWYCVDRNLICLPGMDGSCKAYLVSQKKLLDLEEKTFSDVDSISNIQYLKDGCYLFEGEKGEETVGYLLEIQP